MRERLGCPLDAFFTVVDPVGNGEMDFIGNPLDADSDTGLEGLFWRHTMGTDGGTLPFSVIDEGLGKRTKQFMARGMSWEKASKVAMQELSDKLNILDLVDNSPADSDFTEET